MEDQTTYTPPPVKGYRNLTQAEIDAVNHLKALEQQVLEALRDIPAGSFDPRTRAVAKTQLQTGFMWAARAVFRPETVEF